MFYPSISVLPEIALHICDSPPHLLRRPRSSSSGRASSFDGLPFLLRTACQTTAKCPHFILRSVLLNPAPLSATLYSFCFLTTYQFLPEIASTFLLLIYNIIYPFIQFMAGTITIAYKSTHIIFKILITVPVVIQVISFFS